MHSEVIEHITFRLKPGIGEAAFQAAAAPAYAICDSQPGFRWRRQLHRADGAMIDIIEWADMAAAEAASAVIGSSPDCAAFLSTIDMASTVIEHLPVQARSKT